MRDIVRFVTPLPPARSGIAQYSADLLSAIDRRWPVTVIRDGEQPVGRAFLQRRRRDAPLDPTTPTVLQVGNSGFHSIALEYAQRESGVLVLHDVVLHHGRLGEYIRRRRSREYRALMERQYGAEGRQLAGTILRGHVPADLSEHPLCEDLVERAAITVVHSEYARGRVRRHVPGADVRVVPMGVPLPALVDRDDARRVLGLPRDAFIVASITHVNPYKRLDVVVRAMRRVIGAIPEARLIVAGSIAPSVPLADTVRLWGLSNHVSIIGYVDDDRARLLAQAADACVNLRFPSTGETSASLLRLLGAGRPVLITDDVSTAEYPADVALRVPVDALEDEFLAELLIALAESDELRQRVGTNARRFIEQRHSMNAALAGYRCVLHAAFGMDMPEIEAANLHEPTPAGHTSERVVSPLTWIEEQLTSALVGSGIGAADATIRAALRASRELQLHAFTGPERGSDDG